MYYGIAAEARPLLRALWRLVEAAPVVGRGGAAGCAEVGAETLAAKL